MVDQISTLGIAPEYLAAVTVPLNTNKKLVTTNNNTNRLLQKTTNRTTIAPALRNVLVASSSSSVSHPDGNNDDEDDSKDPYIIIPEVTGTTNLQFRDSNMKYTGDLVNGIRHGRGTLILDDGTRYAGTFVNGYLHGVGTITYPDGSEYKGDIEQGYRHGTGTFSHAYLRTQYIGNWNKGKREGQGVLYYAYNNNTINRNWYYKGEWFNNKRHGKGVLVYPSGNVYSGEWENDMKNGLGRMIWTDKGEEYIGGWLNDVQHGKGIHTWYITLPHNIRSIIAQQQQQLQLKGTSSVSLENTLNSTLSSSSSVSLGGGLIGIQNALHASQALGTRIILPNPINVALSDKPFQHYLIGSRYKGDFLYGYRHGFGTFLYSSGAKYIGEWIRDLKHGHGLWVSNDGSVLAGLFWADQPTRSAHDVVNVKLPFIPPSLTMNNGTENTATSNALQAATLAATMAQKAVAQYTAAFGTANNQLLRPIDSDPLFAVRIRDLLPTDSDFLQWYIESHPQRLSEMEEDNGAGGTKLAFRLRLAATAAIENVLLRWNTRLTNWYNYYSRLAFITNPSKAEYHDPNCIPPSHTAIISNPDALLRYFRSQCISIETGCVSPTKPILRLKHLWKFLQDCGLLHPPLITLATVSDILLGIRARQSRAIIDAAGLLAPLASHVLAEEEVNALVARLQQEKGTQEHYTDSSSSNNNNNNDRKSIGSRSSSKRGNSPPRNDGGGASKTTPATGKKSSTKKGTASPVTHNEEKKNEDENSSSTSSSLSTTSKTNELLQTALYVPPEAANAVSRIVRTELANLGDAQRFRYDPDSPVLFREFTELVLRIAVLLFTTTGTVLPPMDMYLGTTQNMSNTTVTVQLPNGDTTTTTTTTNNGIFNMKDNASIVGDNSVVDGTGTKSVTGTMVLPLSSSRSVATGTGYMSPEKKKAMNYGRLKRDPAVSSSANSYTAISGPPKVHHNPSLGSVALFNATGVLPSLPANIGAAGGANSTAPPPPGSPEELAHAIECCLWYHIHPFAMTASSSSSSFGNNHGGTNTSNNNNSSTRSRVSTGTKNNATDRTNGSTGINHTVTIADNVSVSSRGSATNALLSPSAHVRIEPTPLTAFDDIRSTIFNALQTVPSSSAKTSGSTGGDGHEKNSNHNTAGLTIDTSLPTPNANSLEQAIRKHQNDITLLFNKLADSVNIGSTLTNEQSSMMSSVVPNKGTGNNNHHDDDDSGIEDTDATNDDENKRMNNTTKSSGRKDYILWNRKRYSLLATPIEALPSEVVAAVSTIPVPISLHPVCSAPSHYLFGSTGTEGSNGTRNVPSPSSSPSSGRNNPTDYTSFNLSNQDIKWEDTTKNTTNDTYGRYRSNKRRPLSFSFASIPAVPSSIVCVRDLVRAVLDAGILEKGPDDVNDTEITNLIGPVLLKNRGLPSEATGNTNNTTTNGGPTATNSSRRPSVTNSTATNNTATGKGTGTSPSKPGSVIDNKSTTTSKAEEAAIAAAEARKEEARNFARNCAPLKKFVDTCQHIADDIPHFDVTSLLRSIYSVIRPSGSPHQVKLASQQALKVNTKQYRHPSHIHSTGSTTNGRDNNPNTRNPSTDDNAGRSNGIEANDSIMTSATGTPAMFGPSDEEELASLPESVFNDVDQQLMRILPRTFNVPSHTSKNDTSFGGNDDNNEEEEILTADILPLPLVEVEFMEAVTRTCALYSASAAARRNYVEEMNQRLILEAGEMLNAVEKEARNQYKIGDGGASNGVKLPSRPGSGGKARRRPGSAPIFNFDNEAVKNVIAEVRIEAANALSMASAKLAVLNSQGILQPSGDSGTTNDTGNVKEKATLLQLPEAAVHAQVVISTSAHGHHHHHHRKNSRDNAVVASPTTDTSTPRSPNPVDTPAATANNVRFEGEAENKDSNPEDTIELPEPAYVPDEIEPDSEPTELAAVALPAILPRLLDSIQQRIAAALGGN